MANLPKKIQRELPFLPLFIDELAEVQKDLSKKQKQHDRNNSIVVFLVSTTSLFSDFAYFQYYAGFIIVTGFSYFLYSYLQKRKFKKQYHSLFENNIQKFITGSFQSDWHYSAIDFVDFDEIDEQAAQIFEGNIHVTRWHYNVSGSFFKYPLIIRNLSATLRENRKQSVFNGLLLRLELPTVVDFNTVVTPRNNYQNVSAIGTNLLALHQMNFNIHNDVDTNFTRYFKLYSTKNGTKPDFFTPTLQRQLAHFITNHKVQLHLYFYENQLYASLRTNKDIQIPKINESDKIEPTAIAFYEELNTILDLLKRLDQGGLFEMAED